MQAERNTCQVYGSLLVSIVLRSSRHCHFEGVVDWLGQRYRLSKLAILSPVGDLGPLNTVTDYLACDADPGVQWSCSSS